MTQEVQPLTWHKRTNIEEHQQFFSKINEIIDNLAPTVDEAEAAIGQATAAIASANDAIATANAASAAASAAASQAQTAASTVAGYDTRLTAAEGDIDDLQAADQTITGNVAALGTRMTAAESKNTQQDNSIANIGVVTTQLRDDITALQAADRQNVKINRINEYAVGLTGNQNPISGIKTYTSIAYHQQPIYVQSMTDETNVQPDVNQFYPVIGWRDKNNHTAATLVLIHNASTGKLTLYARLLKWDPDTQTEVQVGVANIVVEP